MAKAKELATRQGYEFCMPAEQKSMTLPVRHKSPPRNIPRDNYPSLMEKLARMPNGLQKPGVCMAV